MVFTDISAPVVLLPLIISVPVFWLLRKTLLRGDRPEEAPGPTPKRLLAAVILLISYVVPCAVLYHLWINPIFW